MTLLIASKNPIQLIASGSGNMSYLLPIAENFLSQNKINFNKFIPYVTTHPFYTATEEERLKYLSHALLDQEPSILWAIRGGSGTTALLPELRLLNPTVQHTIIGFSDVTALHLMCIKLWDWMTIHGPTLSYAKNSLPDSYWQPTLNLVKTGQLNTQINDLIPLNQPALTCGEIRGVLTGGNMSLIQASIGTFWQLESNHKIIFFEDINEAPYRVAERLEHLKQAGLFKNVQAILFGDFTYELYNQTDSKLISYVLKTFAQKQDIPVFSNLPTGHGDRNVPLTLNHYASIIGGDTGRFSQTLDN